MGNRRTIDVVKDGLYRGQKKGLRKYGQHPKESTEEVYGHKAQRRTAHANGTKQGLQKEF